MDAKSKAGPAEMTEKGKFWRIVALEKPFHFTANSTCSQIIETLTTLDESSKPLSSRDRLTLIQDTDPLRFTYEREQFHKGTRYRTAVAEGRVWEDARGVVVEGWVRVDVATFWMTLLFFAGVFVVFGLMSGSWIHPASLLMSVIGAGLLFRYAWDRLALIQQIQQAVDTTNRPPQNVTSYETGSSLAAGVPADSLWNKAISEYQDHEIQRDTR